MNTARRSTAKERLRVARQLAGRPLVAAAMAAGRLSYSKARAITRIADADAETDEALLVAAGAGTAADLERLAQHWERLQEQDVAPGAAWLKRGLRHWRRQDGLATIEITLPIEDAERLIKVLDVYIEHLLGRRPGADEETAPEASAGASECADGASTSTEGEHGASAETAADAGCVEPSADDDAVAPAEAPVELRPTWAQRRADALPDLIELALGHLDAEVDVERARIDVLLDYDTLVERAHGTAEVGAGKPLSGEAARRLACDAGIVRIVTHGRSEVLDVGRHTREGNRAQRRAIRARHGHRCAVRGCEHTIVQIHHTDPWGDGGRTDLELGVPLCRAHHHLVHEAGWDLRWSADRTSVTLVRPVPRWRLAA
ncbi:MAG: DUF222 domain-containing protein [Actinomycetota bacterium]|nr:DUF222 domain-containing protein [Actinomycetota bacterium]